MVDRLEGAVKIKDFVSKQEPQPTVIITRFLFHIFICKKNIYLFIT